MTTVAQCRGVHLKEAKERPKTTTRIQTIWLERYIMSEIAVDFQTDTFELDDEASEIYTSDWEWSGGEGSVKLNVESVVGTMNARVEVAPEDDDPEEGGDDVVTRCWEFVDEKDDRYGCEIPVDAEFDTDFQRDFITVHFFEEDDVSDMDHWGQMEEHHFDSGVHATSMRLVER